MRDPIVMVLNRAALPAARQLQSQNGWALHGLSKRLNAQDGCNVFFVDTIAEIGNLFEKGYPIIGFCAAGILIRALANHLSDKQTEPPVISVSEDGKSVVPLLGGHHGANEMAEEIASLLNGHAAVTTAGDSAFGIALDAPPNGYTLANPEDAKSVMASVLNGERARLVGDVPFASSVPQDDQGKVVLETTTKSVVGSASHLVYHPKSLVMGLGAIRNADPAALIALAEATLTTNELSPRALSCVTSLDLKADEKAVLAVADHFDVPARFFDSKTLEAETSRLANPSDVVFAEVGCHGVAEGAALAAVGQDGSLIAEKQIVPDGTCAIAEALSPIDPQTVGRARGRLAVVGLGPGTSNWQTPEVSNLLAGTDHLVGYSLYLDLLGDQAKNKVRHDFPLGAEEDRVRHALELAGQGQSVALVCSGDPGIYAMATLVWECLEKTELSDGARRAEIIVTPGISALQAASARVGAMLGHDFCTISLSDLLTPWDVIQDRIQSAAGGDFVIAFYNPVSKKRRTQLAYAREVLLQHRPADTPVVLGTNLGRPEEKIRVVDLQALNVDDVDMLTVVLVGSSASRRIQIGGEIKAYTPRGYEKKRLGQQQEKAS